MTERELARFTEKVVIDPSGCWLWTGALNSRGYPCFGIEGRSQLAHRLSYMHHTGPIPLGMTVDHDCNVRRCVNPAHLEPMTLYKNILKSSAPTAVNARKTHCVRGHPLSGENLFVKKNGKRQCRTCKNADQRRWRSAARAMSASNTQIA